MESVNNEDELIASAQNMKQALEAIAHMQVSENTDFRELAALCMSIANITLESI